MRKSLLILTMLLANPFYVICLAEQNRRHTPAAKSNVPRDSIILSDPAVLVHKPTSTYYMTGTGGLLWKSKDLSHWDGPYSAAQPSPTSWMGAHPQIWAAELHEYNGKFYYFATFTNDSIIIETNKEGRIPRRASHILSADTPEGPYTPVSDHDYLPSDRPTLDGTFWIEDGKPWAWHTLKAVASKVRGYKRKNRLHPRTTVMA